MVDQNKPGLVVVDLVSESEKEGFAPAGRMARAIIEITQEKGGCLPQDLNERGFTPSEVTEHWKMAKALAAVELSLTDEQPVKRKPLFGRK